MHLGEQWYHVRSNTDGRESRLITLDSRFDIPGRKQRNKFGDVALTLCLHLPTMLETPKPLNLSGLNP